MGKINKRTAKGVIDRFVRSKRTLLPPNVQLYKTGNFKEDFCPFCDEPHDDLMLMYRPTLHSQLIILEGVSTCIFCNNCLELKTEENKMEDLFEGFAKRAGEKTVSRMDDFVYEGIFPSDVHKFYTHLDPDVEPFKVCSDKCIFCEGFTGGERISNTPEVYKEIHTPMGNESYTLDGGVVRICSSCNLILSTRLPQGYMNHVLTYCGFDVCPDCQQQYLISNLEMDARKSEGTFGHHSCSECTYNRFVNSHSLKSGDEDLLSIYNIKRDEETFKINRYVSKDCQSCNDEIGLDITYTPHYILQTYISKQGKYTCGECMFMDNAPTDIVLKDNKVLRIYNIKDKFYVKTSTKNGKHIHLHHELSASEVVNILLENSSTQLELKL